MPENLSTPPVNSPALKWLGRFLSAGPVLLLIMSGVMKLMKPDMVLEGFAKFGYPESVLIPLGVVELVSTLLYIIPQTSVLGAVLLTGYLGGATATHVRVSDPWYMTVILGVVIWLGLVLREPRLRPLLPIRWAVDPNQKGSLLLKAFVVLALAAIGSMTYIAMQPDEMRVTRSMKINAAPAAVFAQLDDFHKWETWSPWAKMDPNAKNTFDGPASGAGAMFHWAGNDQVGEGKMTIVESRPGEFLKMKLEFIKPMQCTNTAEFTLKPEGEQTELVWAMYGHSPFIGKAMGVFMDMDKMVGDDFEKGLASIKANAEGPPAVATPKDASPKEIPATE